MTRIMNSSALNWSVNLRLDGLGQLQMRCHGNSNYLFHLPRRLLWVCSVLIEKQGHKIYAYTTFPLDSLVKATNLTKIQSRKIICSYTKKENPGMLLIRAIKRYHVMNDAIIFSFLVSPPQNFLWKWRGSISMLFKMVAASHIWLFKFKIKWNKVRKWVP
jgi:hypothetical protein